MYVVLVKFNDNVDGGNYNVGEIYPRNDVFPTNERIKYLLSSKNNAKKPVIKFQNKINLIKKDFVENTEPLRKRKSKARSD